MAKATTKTRGTRPPKPGTLLTDATAHRAAGDARSAADALRLAFAQASAAGDADVAVEALQRLAFCTFELGQLRRAEELARRVCQCPDLATAATAATAAAQCHLVLGLVSGLRGRWHDASQQFDLADEVVSDDPGSTRWALQLARAFVLARYQPDEGLTLARQVAAQPLPGLLVWRSQLVEGVARVAAGESGGTELLRTAVTDARGPWEEALAGLCLGEALLSDGDAKAAAAVLAPSMVKFEEQSAGYWLARTLVAMAQADPAIATTHRAVAETLDDGDAAYTRLFDDHEELRIHLGADPGLWLGAEQVTFIGRQAEYTLYALALAGDTGLELDRLAAQLWPAPDTDRLAGRVRTLLWQVRRALGSEAWRLRRKGNHLSLDLRGITVTGVDENTALLEGWDFLGPEALDWLSELAVTRPAA